MESNDRKNSTKAELENSARNAHRHVHAIPQLRTRAGDSSIQTPRANSSIGTSGDPDAVVFKARAWLPVLPSPNGAQPT